MNLTPNYLRDCADICGGSAEIDRCDICNGNSEYCVGCTDSTVQRTFSC